MKVLVLIAVLACVAVEYVSAEFRCSPGVPYRENDCNNCVCSDSNQLGCTYKFCAGEKYEQLHNCQVGSQWDEGCNKCECATDLGTICTNNDC